MKLRNGGGVALCQNERPSEVNWLNYCVTACGQVAEACSEYFHTLCRHHHYHPLQYKQSYIYSIYISTDSRTDPNSSINRVPCAGKSIKFNRFSFFVWVSFQSLSMLVTSMAVRFHTSDGTEKKIVYMAINTYTSDDNYNSK